MFTQADVNAVIAYNNSIKAKIYTVVNNKVRWDLRNADVAHLNNILSTKLVYAEDVAKLKKQVRATLLYIAMLTAAQQAA